MSAARTNALTAQLIGDSLATAASVTVESSTPVLDLCRRLVAAAFEPDTPLALYRGDVVCLLIRSIGEAAQLNINGKGNGFKHRATVGRAPPIAPDAEPLTDHHPARPRTSGRVRAGWSWMTVLKWLRNLIAMP